MGVRLGGLWGGGGGRVEGGGCVEEAISHAR